MDVGVPSGTGPIAHGPARNPAAASSCSLKRECTARIGSNLSIAAPILSQAMGPLNSP
jgi:hypothetical protein